MKMIIAILRDVDSDQVTQALTDGAFKVTRVASTGGLLKRGVTTLFAGVEDGKVDSALQTIKANLSPAPEGERRATIFVVPVEDFEQV
jgi:uncharacterized protein YaaQ